MRTDKRTRASLLGLVGLLLAVGCSMRGGPKAAVPVRRDLITREELLGSIHSDLDVLQAIRALRPQFLASPPGIQRSSAPRQIMVYIDGVRQPVGTDVLRAIRASSVDEIRYLEPTAAANQLGPLAAGGAVMLKLHTVRRDTPPPVRIDTIPEADASAPGA